MKTFDKYIQGRILKAYNDAPGEGICDNFNELAYWFKYDSIDNTARFMQRYGIGKQRSRDYAHYIVAWLEEQKADEKELEFATCPRCGGDAYKILHCCHSECELNLAGHSHLTDEDAEKLLHLITQLTANVEWSYNIGARKVEIYQLLNSLKGE